MSSSDSWAVALLKRAISDLEVFEDGRNIPEGTLDSFVVSLELAYRELVVLDTTSQLTSSQREPCDIIQASLVTLIHCLELCQASNVLESTTLPVATGQVGRLSYTFLVITYFFY